MRDAPALREAKLLHFERRRMIEEMHHGLVRIQKCMFADRAAHAIEDVIRVRFDYDLHTRGCQPGEKTPIRDWPAGWR